MTNENIAQSEATQEVIDSSVNQNQEVSNVNQEVNTETQPVVNPTDEKISKVEQRIRKLANEKNEYRDEVQQLREELLKVTERPLIEPSAEDYGEDLDAFVDAKFEYKMKLQEKAQREEASRQAASQQAHEREQQAWQSKIDSLPAERREGYHGKVKAAQENGQLNLPQEVLTTIAQSPVGPELVLELIENPNVIRDVQSARSVGELNAIVSNAEHALAAKRYNYTPSATPVTATQTEQITSAAPAMPTMGNSTGVNPTDPRKMSSAEFRNWYKQSRHR